MTQLALKEGALKALERTWKKFESIDSVEDLERQFLQGNGLSDNTYRTYRQALKDFYEWSDGKHPFQVTAADIEAWYDDLRKKLDLDSAYLKIRGLKKFFLNIETEFPFPDVWKSLFRGMPEKLIKKLNQTKGGNRTKAALEPEETKLLLEKLRANRTLKGLEDYAIVYMLVTSGLRSAELLDLQWKDLECLKGKWTARFIGKGGRVAEQELWEPAVEACRLYFKKHFKRNPQPDDYLFYTMPSFPGEESRRLPYNTLRRRMARTPRRRKWEVIFCQS